MTDNTNVTAKLVNSTLTLTVDLSKSIQGRNKSIIAACHATDFSINEDPTLKAELFVSQRLGATAPSILVDEEETVKSPVPRTLIAWNAQHSINDNILTITASLMSTPPGSSVALREQIAHLFAEEGLNERPDLKVLFKCYRIPASKGSVKVDESVLVKKCVEFNSQLNQKRNEKMQQHWTFC
ncbi:hypothetical protein P9112_012092 [Eukaryota sp. TZLM1-RC]